MANVRCLIEWLGDELEALKPGPTPEPPGRRRPSLASVTDLTPRRDLLGKVQ
jgi:hypothetical protein